MPQSHSDLLVSHRILDANLNRAMEGLRSLEDIARFQNQAAFQSQFKDLRHSLQLIATHWNQELLIASRNADDDVGRAVKTSAEADRSQGLASVCEAAAQRVQQALRCLEEIAKFQYPPSASKLESIRYQSYDLNARLLQSQRRDTAFLKKARLYVLADCQLPIDLFQRRVESISQAGVDIIQIRDKHADARVLIQYTQAAIESVDPASTRIVVNDRADVVQCTNAWGLHVGQTDLSVQQSRSLIRSNCVIGLSTHDLAQVLQANHLGVDYIGCGPTFPSSTKNFQAFAGLNFLREVVENLDATHNSVPAFAIGGIDELNLGSLLETGIRRIAVSKAVWNAPQPDIAVRKLTGMLDAN
jgi:thiamine-phosphate pyrophosphorylase